jgi:hypothetical protein
VVGRIAGIINHRHNRRYNLKTARFGFWECINDPSASDALFTFVENWAIEHGQQKIVGPMGFSDQDPEGLLIEGFNYLPSLATYTNSPYMVSLVDRAGYKKEIDYLSYKVNLRPEIKERYINIQKRLLSGDRFQLMEFESRKELKDYVHPILRVMNETFEPLYGYVPLSDEEMTELAERYLPIIDPRFVKAVKQGDEVVAFMIAMPNIAQGIRRAEGRLLPFGWFHIWRDSKNSKQLDLMLGGIKEDVRGVGLDTILGISMLISAEKAGFELIDSHLILETNRLMRAEMERWGGNVYKRHRIYKKKL